MRPVLLLNVRIVVFLVRPTSCELNPPPATVTLQMVVDEFRAVVRINAPQGKWQALPHLLHRRHDPGLALSQHRPRLHCRLSELMKMPVLIAKRKSLLCATE